jgi:ribonuclease R
MKKNKNMPKTPNTKAVEQAIKNLFNTAGNKPLNVKQIASQLGMRGDQAVLYAILKQLSLKDEIEEIEPGRFVIKRKEEYITGKIDLLNSGNAYLVSEELEKDVFIGSRYLNNAFHGDIVVVKLRNQKIGKSPEGEVVEIKERGKAEYVGRIELEPRVAYVVADSNKMPMDILVPMDKTMGAADGMKVQVRITQWPKRDDENPVGEVIKVLGNSGENNTEMHSILAEYGLPYEFSFEVESDADKISFDIPKSEISKRKDFRSVTTFTIDPADAKDFDDALSLEILKNGNYRVGVHIADVSHYMPEKSVLDKEAYKRGTSVYLVDRVVPMLPEKLSNGVCSLRPNEEKLCYSAVFELDSQAKVIDQWFGRTVIYSDRRFTYEEAQHVIETGEGDFKEEILTLHKLAQIMRKERFASGALKVHQEEVKFMLDEAGKPVEVYFKIQKESNQLIEEFMLLANKKVAEFIGKRRSRTDKHRPFVYRIHDAPDPEKLADFAAFVKNFGHKLSLDNPKQISKSLNKLLENVKGKPEENMVESLAIRSMAKAIYSTKNIGHYGLAFDYYTHFTSPIRRYPDVMVHRLLTAYLTDEGYTTDENKLEAKCKHCSEREKLAAEAERASIKYKQVEYMLERVGRTYAGIVSGVTEWGMFVEIEENHCEGLVRLRSIEDDFYYFDEKNYCIIGKRRRKKFSLGDKVMVYVNKVDMEKRQIDLLLDVL